MYVCTFSPEKEYLSCLKYKISIIYYNILKYYCTFHMHKEFYHLNIVNRDTGINIVYMNILNG